MKVRIYNVLIVLSNLLKVKNVFQSKTYIYWYLLCLNFLLLECSIGYHGKDCTQKCIYPFYGEGCQSICACLENECHFSRGCFWHTETDTNYQRPNMPCIRHFSLHIQFHLIIPIYVFNYNIIIKKIECFAFQRHSTIFFSQIQQGQF